MPMVQGFIISPPQEVVRMSTSAHLSAADARKKGLPGSDVYRATHIIYLDELHRDHGVVRLCREALKAFTDTVMIRHRLALSAEHAEATKWVAAGGLAAAVTGGQ